MRTLKSNKTFSMLYRLFHGIAFKIVLLALVVVFIPIYWLNREAVTFFDVFNRQALENNMRHYAMMVGSQYKQMLTSNSEVSAASVMDFEKQLREYDRRMNIHIRILDPKGNVLLGSRESSEKNLSYLREVRQSLEGGYAMRNAITEDRKYMNYYLAWPVKSDDLKYIVAVVHIVQDTNDVIRAIKRMIQRQQFATWIALLAAGFIAVLFAGGITRPLVHLTQSARSFALKETRFKSCLKRRNDEIGQLDNALRLMANEINDRNSYNREFVDALQHEYIGALAGIKGAVDNLNDGAKDDPCDRDRFIESISLQTQRMLNLIRQLNDLSQLGVESLRDRKKRVSLQGLIAESVNEVKQGIEEPYADIVLPQECPAVELLAVPELIKLVFQNLVKNALRHTPSSGFVKIEVSQEGMYTKIKVRDNGDGVSESDLPHIFERFFTTVPRNRVRSGGAGLGLGLAIVKQIIEAHDGSVSCNSVKGEGAEFVILFMKDIFHK